MPSSNAIYWAAKIELNQERDRAQTTALRAEGWYVIRIWEHEKAELACNRVAAATYAAIEVGASDNAALKAPATA